ncbi:MAG: hypothetical protein HC772_20315, partial [Leptolyngbyaceae cyanobacterium CRU_2_3]|nr:hypothetical protein [Leptolyngbyaceae cyanobacterium CRU_2_3]
MGWLLDKIKSASSEFWIQQIFVSLASTNPVTDPYFEPPHLPASATVTILGAGAWGTALAALATIGGHSVQLWSRQSQQPLAEAIAAADIVLSAVSMRGVPDTALHLQAAQIPANAILVTATKGLDPATRQTPAQIWQAAFPDHAVVVLSGPNLSEEIRQGLPTATVVASHNLVAAERVQSVFASD